MNFQQLPSLFPEQEIYGAQRGGFTFVITRDEKGYTASAKSGEARIDLGGYGAHKTFQAAKTACLTFLKKNTQ